MAESEREKAADWFRRFADAEGAESPRYRDWALGIAGDDELLARIVRLPVAKRQPVLVLTCARVAGVPLSRFSDVRSRFVELWPDIARLATVHSTQTNDPRRCTPLVAALNQIRGPIALIEAGASAGLTMIPDLYSYRWSAPGRELSVDPKSGPSIVAIHASMRGWGANAPVIPTISYREGIDLNPLDVSVDADRNWLEALVWPEQRDRRDLVQSAVTLVRGESLRMTKGDALTEIRRAVARARRHAPNATVVIWSPAVLVYLAPERRSKFARYCRRANVRWISLDGRGVLEGLDARATEMGLDGDYVLTLDGTPIASVDPLGRWVRMADADGLAADDRDLIEFERLHWGEVRGKESLVRKHWGIPLVRYYQRLYGIMESVAARRYDPILVRTFDEARDRPPAHRR